MKLPIPIFTENKVYTNVEIIRPKSSVIADTKRITDQGQIFSAIKLFVSGCIESISNEEEEITNKQDIKRIISKLPFRSSELVITNIMLLHDKDLDGVEGVYPCPRCEFKFISELVNDDDIEIDTRDFISNLTITNMENIEESFILELKEPIIIKNKATEEVLESIFSLELRHPTLSDCIKAERKQGTNDAVRMQFSMYIESLLKVNGNEIDNKYKSVYGMLIFENIKDVKKDLGYLNDMISMYGINPEVEKTCTNCGKVWKTHISMSNFFVSGLTI